MSPTEEHPPEKKVAPAPRRNRIVAPPPAQYIKDDGGDLAASATSSKPLEQKGRMLYAYQQNGEGEITIAEGRDVIILEPDGESPRPAHP